MQSIIAIGNCGILKCIEGEYRIGYIYIASQREWQITSTVSSDWI